MLKRFLKFYSEKFSEFLKADGWLVFLLIILNVTIFIQSFVYGSEIRPLKNILSEATLNFYSGAFVILIFCAAIYFSLKNFPRVKFSLQILLLVLSAIFFMTDVFLLYKFKLVLQEYMILIILGTNPITVKEFFWHYVIDPKIIISTAAIIWLIIFEVKKLRLTFQNLSEKILHRVGIYLLIMSLPLIVIAVCYSNIIFDITKYALSNTLIGRNIFNTCAAIETAGNETEISATMNRQNEKIISNNSKIPYVVFILGESETRNHMQIYGYNLGNTPLAVERFKRGELIKFNDTIACANYTFTAMELIFTFSEKEDSEKWYTKPNIFDILRRAGYHTAWISNQSAVGLWDSTDKIYSMRCDEKFFAESESSKTKIFSRDVDGVLIPALDKFLKTEHEKNFYLVHLYGSHAKYKERYPAEFAKFTAADEDKPTDEGKKVSAEYDNAVLYADFILDEIFKRFEDKNALIIYISDHGEEVYENGSGMAGHTPEENGNISMVEIPFFVWTSDKFREMYPEKISALKNAADNPYRTDLIIHTILDLMDIQTESFDATKSIVNENFDKFRIRIYNNKPYIKG